MLTRLAFTWTLAYLVLAQAIIGAFAAGAMAGRADAGTILCTAAIHDPGDADDSSPHDGVLRGLHCLLCPASGSVPVLVVPPRLPLPAAPVRIGAPPLRGNVAVSLPILREHARPRAPPTTA